MAFAGLNKNETKMKKISLVTRKDKSKNGNLDAAVLLAMVPNFWSNVINPRTNLQNLQKQSW